MGRLATALAVSAGALAVIYVASCVLPGEPSGAGRIQFTLDGSVPYRVPLAGVVEPLITISADGQVLSNPSYRLETLDIGVVRVDSTEHRLLGVARGTAAVRVTYLGTTGTPDTVFPVQVVISRVAVDTPSPVTRLGATVRLSALAFDANSAVVPNVGLTWSSADSGVARVDQTGLVTAVNEGVVTIAAAADGVAGSSSVVVTQLAAQVRVAPGIDTLRTVGRKTQFIAVAFDDSGRVLGAAKPRWSSSDTSIVRVDSTGLATATGGGSAHIIARVGTAADTATLVVAQVVRFLAVAPGLDTLTAIQDSGRIVATAADTLGNPIPNPSVAWVTGDPAIATVDQTGRVTATRNGVVLVTASSAGQSAFATVVVHQEVATVRVSAHSVALTGQGDTVRLSAVGLDRNGYPVAGTVFAWRHSTCVATVDAAGLVRASGGGSAAIIATLANGEQSDTAVVSVAGAPPSCRHAIAFLSDRDGNYEIYVMDSDGSDPLDLTNNPAFDEDAAWSPDGTRIAFLSLRDGNDEIYVMNADGSGVQKLTNTGDNWGPVWSPDGTRIAFSSYRDGNVEIYVTNADGSSQVNLTNNPGTDYLSAWSPDGTRIAFTSDRDGYFYMYVMNADGSAAQKLNNYLGYGLVWSPDGSRIAFYASSIYVMNADGSSVQRLTDPFGTVPSGPAWSPDGSKIAYGFLPCADGVCNGDISNIGVVNADGSSITQLTFTGHDFLPVWSPDGTRIAFPSDRDGKLEIYVMSADGSDPLNLTNNPGLDYVPIWRPR